MPHRGEAATPGRALGCRPWERSPTRHNDAGQQAHQSEWLDWAIRAGLVAYGVVHLMVGWLAAQLALGEKSESASNAGALHALAEQPMGGVLIWMIAVGMMLLVVWRLLEFAMGYQDETDDAKRWRKRLASLGKAILYGVLAWSAVKVAVGDGSQRRHRLHDRQADGPARRAAHRRRRRARDHRLRRPAGLPRVDREVHRAPRLPRASPARTARRSSLFGKVGYIAKGIAIGIVGGLFCYAAITHDAKESGGLDQALQTVLEQPFGQVLLARDRRRHRLLRPVLLRPRPAPVALSGGRTDERAHRL